MTSSRPSALVVGREADGAAAVVALLRARDWEVAWARDGEGAFRALDEGPFDALICELRSPRIDGLAVLRRARARRPDVCAVVTAAAAPTERAAEAMREGAADVQLRPLHPERLLAVLERGLSHQRLARRLAEAEEDLDERYGVERLTGRSRAIARVMDQIRHVAASRGTVLIEGEPGTGKGVVARILHQSGPRKGERFVWTSGAALAAGGAEGELFGDQRDPRAVRPGRLEIADGGTLFVDGVSELPAAAQFRLLRFLRDREFERVGGRETLRADVRLIASTHRDLATEVREGRFREDLEQRLSAVRIELPPLRDRREDLALLVASLLRELNRAHGRRVTGVSRGVLDRFAQHGWPGNVRELRDLLEGMVVFAHGRRALDVSDLPPALGEGESAAERLTVTVGMTLEEVERRLIEATLRHARHDKPRAAAMLGMGLRTLYRKIDDYALRPPAAPRPRARPKARVPAKPRRRPRR